MAAGIQALSMFDGELLGSVLTHGFVAELCMHCQAAVCTQCAFTLLPLVLVM